MSDEVLPHGLFPFSWTELSDEENKRIKAANPMWPFNDMIRYSENVTLPRPFRAIADRLYNFSVKEDDIWIVTFPKCGTTWMQETVWQIVNGVDKEGGQMPLYARSPFIERGGIDPPLHLVPREAKSGVINKMSAFKTKIEHATGKEQEGMLALMKHNGDPIEYARTLTGRRVIKCHLPMDCLPRDVLEKCKIVYVARNPKDCATSYYHQKRNLHGWLAGFDEFLKQFEENLLNYGSFWHHLLGGWEYKDHKNVSFIWFEEMKKDQRSVIQGLCQFLDQPLAEEKVDELVEWLRFDNMKQNNATNMSFIKDQNGQKHGGEFMRKGEVGNWKVYFDEETDQRWNEWIKKNIQGKNLIIPGK